jgi:hypothetical protein
MVKYYSRWRMQRNSESKANPVWSFLLDAWIKKMWCDASAHCVLSNLCFDVLFRLAPQNEIPLLMLFTNSYNLSAVGICSWMECWQMALTASLFIVPSIPNVACFCPLWYCHNKTALRFLLSYFSDVFGCSNLSTLFHHTPSQATKLNLLAVGWQCVSCSVFTSVRYYEEKRAALYPYHFGCISYAGGSTVAWLLLQWLPPVTSSITKDYLIFVW